MTFFQPWMLWALPLALVPVILHLLNRMRYRDVPWAAMQFLLKANSASTRQARLKHWLILACRVLALAALVFVLSRPLAGGWLGWAVSGTPEVVVVLLDRSASMETHDDGAAMSLRQKSLHLLAGAMKAFGSATRLVLIDSATREARELATPDILPELSAAAPSDTAANLHAMVDTAAEWLTRHPVGNAEVWIATDLQQSNWNPRASAWRSAATRLAAAPGNPRVRVLDAGAAHAVNASVEVTRVEWRRKAGTAGPGSSGGSPAPAAAADAKGEGADLLVTLRIQRLDPSAANIPLAITLDGVRTTSELKVEGQDFYVRKVLAVQGDTTEVRGSVEIPADANMLDNTAWFVARPPTPQLHSVVAEDSACSRILTLSAAPAPALRPQRVEGFSPRSLPSDLLSPATAPSTPPTSAAATNAPAAPGATAAPAQAGGWERFGAVIWQGALPVGDTAAMLKAYIQNGGVVVFFPPSSGAAPALPAGTAATDQAAPAFGGVVWGAPQITPKEDGWRVGSWDEQDGPLAKSEEGINLPVGDLRVSKRQEILPGDAAILARFGDGQPFLVRARLGAGAVYFCATLPLRDWSTLARGDVLLPMVQRMVSEGARRLSTPYALSCGEPLPPSPDGWIRLDGEPAKAAAEAPASPAPSAAAPAPGIKRVPDFNAGIYRGSPGLIAVNRPTLEDDPQRVEQAEALRTLAPLSVSILSAASIAAPVPGTTAAADTGGGLQGEVWRGFLVTMLLLLVAEAALTLPAPAVATDPKRVATASASATGVASRPAAPIVASAAAAPRPGQPATAGKRGEG
ncbi:hypothetical protein DB346_22175 [Verrucomicrobia bacterium LW23]|nr:hypothetical protein DB346_22175 [Verrucomicrobia bacterium LW23]